MNIILLKDRQPYYFTNENLRIGDKVFPLADGICENKLFYISSFANLNDEPFKVRACTGWPSEPHTIIEFYESDGIPYIRTNKGYSPSERYFKMKENV